MNCFPCFLSKKSKTNEEQPENVPVARVRDTSPPSPPHVNNARYQPAEVNGNKDETNPATNNANAARTFTFRELAMATKNFRQECLIVEGGFGKVYKATLQSGEVVAVKRLDRTGTQGNKEFLVEVLMLTLLHHPNLVNLIGYCAEGDQRLLVNEYLPFGSVEAHLHDIAADKKALSWETRMKIASGAAQGLEYLHDKANPPIIYRDLKTSNVLLDDDFNPRLSDYGLAKLTQGNSKMHSSPRVMGTYGYCAPEYERQGEVTTKSDVYSFGVILLELITGRKALDTTRPTEEQNLVTWAKPIFRNPKRFPDMADPLLGKDYPEKSLNQAVGVAAMCLQEEPSVRPLIGDVVAALSFLTINPGPSAEVKHMNKEGDDNDHQSSESSSEEDGDNNNYHDEKSNNKEDGSSSDDDDSSVSSEDEDRAHQQRQESKEQDIWGSSSHHNDKVLFKEESMNFGRQASSSHHRNNKVDYESTTSSSSRSTSNNGSPRHSSRSSSNNAAAPQERQNSREESLGRGMFDESFAWSIGSSSRYKYADGSARINSGTSSYMEMEFHNDSLCSNMRQESSLRSNNERIDSHSRHSRNLGCEDESNISMDSSDDEEIQHKTKS